MHLRLGQATRHDAQDQTSRHRSRRCRLHAQSHRLQSRAHSQAHRRLRRSLPTSRKTASDRPKSNNKGRKRLGYRRFFSKLLDTSGIENPASAGGPASTWRKDPMDALSHAVQMLGKGYSDVVIVDLSDQGKAYAPAEFRELYLDTKK